MSRGERYSTVKEIKRRFPDTNEPDTLAGPVVFYENGRKYCDDSESHVLVIGRTGTGKSQCCVLPFEREGLEKGESFIVLDPKGETYRRNACNIPDGYQDYCIDFRLLRNSPSRWNPLKAPYKLFFSKNPDDHDIASSMISELCDGVYPYDGHSDRFWSESAANYLKGLIYALFETAPEEQINLDSVAVMMEQSEQRSPKGTMLKSLYDALPADSLARRGLATYVSAPNETRASIHSVAASGLEVFSRSRGLMEMLGTDNMEILNLDVTKPFILTIIVPDETNVYDSLAGLLITQVTQHLIRVAQDMDGRLPIRVNIILEELGSIGKSIPNLPNLMVASRSRNMRLMLILQSYSQLEDIYGKSKAEVINSSVGITIAFSTNSWETMKELSQRCGEKGNGEHLVTASKLAAMPIATALVMVDNKFKFISRFPFYDEMYDNSKWKAPELVKRGRTKKRRCLDLEELVKRAGKKERDHDDPFEYIGNDNSKEHNPFVPVEKDGKSGIEEFMARLDMEIERLEEQEKKDTFKKYHVVISQVGHMRSAASVLYTVAGDSFLDAVRLLHQLPQDIGFDDESGAKLFLTDIINAGCKAELITLPDKE